MTFGRSNLPRMIAQTYHVGINYIFIILLSGLFIGFVLTLKRFYRLIKFSEESALDQMVTLRIIYGL